MPTDIISAIDRGLISRYINSFRIAFSKYLKDGVGMQTTVYPYPSGAVVVVEFDFELQAKDLFRSESPSLEESLKRTNLFAEVPSQLGIPGTFIILHRNKTILIKTNDANQWSSSQVTSDIDTIFKSIKSSK